MHAEQIGVIRIGLRPGRQDLRDPVAQHPRLAEQKIALVRELHRSEVAREFHHDAAIFLRGVMEVAPRPGPDRRDVPALAVVGRRLERLQHLEDALQLRLGCRLAGNEEQPRAEAMAHDEGRVGFERRVDLRQRVGEEAEHQRGRLVEGLDRAPVSAGHRRAELVVERHVIPPLLSAARRFYRPEVSGAFPAPRSFVSFVSAAAGDP